MTKSITDVQITNRKPTESRPPWLRLHWLEEDSEFIHRMKGDVQKQKLSCSFRVSEEVQVPVYVQQESRIECSSTEVEGVT